MDKEERVAKANEYFQKETQKVYIDRCNSLGIETFEQYLNHRYRDSCYNYSFYALMGLKNTDNLIRGIIDVYGRGKCNYHHGWVEFMYDGEEYIFDNHFSKVVSKEDWYLVRSPQIRYKKSKKEILDKYLNEDYGYKVTEGFWQMKEVIYKGYKNYKQIKEAEKANEADGYVPGNLQRARVVLSSYDGEVKRFIAYDPPSF